MTAAPEGARTTTETHINWGAVMKGVAIVAGVVVVAVVGAMVAGAAASWLVGALGTNGAFLTPLLHSVAMFGDKLTLLVTGFPGWVASLLPAAAATPLAATPAIAEAGASAATKAAITTGASAIGFGGAIAAGIQHIFPQVTHLPFLDHTTVAQPMPTPDSDNGIHGVLSAKANIAANHAASQLQTDLIDAPDVGHQTPHNHNGTHEASEAAQHANMHDHKREHAPHDRRHSSALSNLSRAELANKAWAERVSMSRTPATPIQPLDADFTQRLDKEAATLNENLATAR